ncbi:hypothetical protein TRAPUB_13467 [Trametes pubescens]|uniref:Uncharacterized protein n=1 Tax=Trametes pubescens TaxID=154538 RepID=A0A1M2VR62_TRAPU|nr:hypothetical protein TRAPUB_13467 [Trametes pubescens]
MAGVFVRLLCTASEEISPAYEEYTRCTAFDPVAHDPLIEARDTPASGTSRPPPGGRAPSGLDLVL